MKKKALRKDFLMELKKSLNRFISIFLIVALGVAFYSGIQSAAPDMRYSGDEYFDENRLMDLKVISTMGLTEGDLEAIRQIKGVELAEAGYMTDVLCGDENNQSILRLESIGEDLNRLTPMEGRVPENPGECFVDIEFLDRSGYKIGDTIEFYRDDEDDFMCRRHEFTLVGAGSSPLYISFNRGNTNIGTGELSGAGYILPEDFDSEVYTQIYVRVDGADDLTAYTDAYDTLIESVQDRIEAIEEERCRIRYQEIMDDANEEIADAEEELADGKAEAESELNDALEELADGELELIDAKLLVARGRRELEKGEKEIADGEAELADGEAEIAENETKLADGWSELASGKSKYNSGKKTLDEKKKEFQAQSESATADLEEGQAQIDAAKAELAAGREQYAAGLAEYEAGKASYEQGESEYAAGVAEYEAQLAAWPARKTELEGQKAQLEAGIARINEGLPALTEGKSQADAACAQLQAAADEANGSISRMQEQIASLQARQTELEQKASTPVAYSEPEPAGGGNEDGGSGEGGSGGGDSGQGDSGGGSGSGDSGGGGQPQPALTPEEEAELASIPGQIDALYGQIAEVQGQLSGYQEQLSAAQQQAAELQGQIDGCRTQLTELEGQLAQLEQGLNDAQAQLDAAPAQQQAARAQLDGVKEQLTQAKATLDASLTQIETGESEIAVNEAKIADGRKKLEDGASQIASAEKELKASKKKITNAENELVSGQAELDSAKTKIADGRAEIADAKEELADAGTKLRDGEEEIAENEPEIRRGKIAYFRGRMTADELIRKGGEKIADAKEDLADLKMPEWSVSDRSVLPENIGYGENADRMRAIGRVFPVLFFLVAALISLTTMTRMVEEERTQIGTLKALGYSKVSIASKYLCYALFATLGGSVAGVLFGEKFLPFVIVTAYKIMYHHMPNIVLPYNLKYAGIATCAALLSTMVATFSSCYRELATTPAVLMRPPAPKEGKRVILERIPFIWKHLSFTWKSTIRNLFRYKKRFLMTVFGIGGCMALMIVGYGLRDSIGDIAHLQFEQLQVYDGMIILDTDADEDSMKELMTGIGSHAHVRNSSKALMKKVNVHKDKKLWNIYITVPAELEKAGEFFIFRDRVSGEMYELSDEGAILTEKIASMMGIRAGDTIEIEDEDLGIIQVPVACITENYLSHYIYMTPALYEACAGTGSEYNEVLFQVTPDTEDLEAVGQEFLRYDAALSISYSRTTMSQLDTMLSTLDSVMIVLIAAAGLLAFVVLYNLNNININERKRELATIKVLGFYNNEVDAYVYRENILITIIGIGVGAGLGKLLHRFIITTVEVDATMFSRNINLPSYVISAAFTVVFSVIVNGFMHFKLKKIDMVESLKSVE